MKTKTYQTKLPLLAPFRLVFVIGLLLAITPRAHAESILNSKHNLSASGPGTIKAATETEVCIFCHTPHHASKEAPLWNRFSSGAEYTLYSSSTAKATIGQPTGASKLCLSCHDGTVALGLVRNPGTGIQMHGGVTTLPAGRSNVGTDLSDDHPVSFVYDLALATAHGELRNPSALTGPVKLDKNKEMQCTSCHDPHNNQFGKFLVQANTGSALCSACHTPNNWTSSSHNTSTATWNGQGQNPWPNSTQTTVAANACENCHTSHSAGTKQRLLNFALEQENCLSCHNGNVAARNISAELNKPSAHPVLSASGVHDPAENLINSTRHSACVDCHNPHATRSAPAVAPNASGALAGVKGESSSGSIVNPVSYEYELCYRCHADSTARGAARVPRVVVETNKRLQFSPGNASFHPIQAVGKNSNVPSLIAPWTSSSQMYCTDCHNNDQGTKAGGSGPNGPHGSVYEPILERQLITTDFSGSSSANSALCYKCHSSASILSDQSFPHSRHIVNDETACTTCHDSHGVLSAPHLVNFNPTYVSNNSKGLRQYNSTGVFHGNCALACHGHDHDPTISPNAAY